MAGLAAGLLVLGPAADAQTSANKPEAKATAGKDAKVKDKASKKAADSKSAKAPAKKGKRR